MTRLRYKKGLRILFWGLGSILILSVAGFIFLNNYLPKLIRIKIHHLVVDGSDSLYKCSIGKVSVNLLRGNVAIEDINISIDSLKYNKLKKIGKLPNITYEIKVLKSSITSLQILPLIFSKKIKIDGIRVEDANIVLCRQEAEKKKPAPTEGSLWKSVRPNIKGIYVNSLILNKTKLTYRHSENKKDITLSYQDCSVQLHHIRIDSIGAANQSRILFTEDIQIKFVGFKYVTNDSSYCISSDTLQYSSLSKRINIKNFQINPTLSPIEFTKKHGMQLDIFESTIPEFTGINFKIEKVFTENEICLDTIILKSPIIKINRDRTAHFDTTSQLGKYPNEALAKAPFTIRIPIIIIDKAEIHYVERQKLTHLIGDAYFTKVTGTIVNLTNSIEDIEKNGHCTFNLNGFFLKHGKMHLQLDFNLSSKNGEFSSRAELGSVSMNELNSIFVPFANIRLKSINVHSSNVQFQGNSKGITGTSRLIYDDLKIDILKPNAKTHKVKKQGFVSFIASIFAIRAHNRVGKKEVIASNIHVIRKRRQPFANLIWEFLFEGLKKIILKIPAKDLKVEM